MPRIDVLPSSSSAAQPGYAFVPDTRYDASRLAGTQPGAGRKRAARKSNLSGGDLSVRQQNAILKHLAELEKDNHRDIQIPVPKETAGRGTVFSSSFLSPFLQGYIFHLFEAVLMIAAARSKMTTNVRRILTSQKTFANHLADEEAAIAQKGNAQPSSSLPAAHVAKLSSKGEVIGSGASSQPAKEDPLEANHLLRTYVPAAPSDEVMDALVSAPPLSFNAARALLPGPGKPQRHFCEICGYWGNIKCMKCGTRVCGLECKDAHDEGRCLKFYG